MKPPLSVFIGPLEVGANFHSWDGTPPNPGIGGTEFQLYSLASELKKRSPDLKIVVLVTAFCRDSRGDGVAVERYTSAQTFRSGDVLICPTSGTKHIKRSQFKGGKLIVSSHHPHDFGKIEALKRLPVSLVRNVGSYSHITSRSKGSFETYIPNLFLSTVTGSRRRLPDRPKVGNISSWHPSKGIHHVMQVFSRLSEVRNDINFVLVGGSSLYENVSRGKVATRWDRKLGKLKIKLEASSNGRVKALGVVTDGVSSVVKDWSLAILNPLGIGESDPASFKDCLGHGVPVVSMGNFGMWDYQRFFPESQARRSREIPLIAKQLLNDDGLMAALSKRSLEIASWLISRNDFVVEKWLETISLVNADIEPGRYQMLSGLPAVASAHSVRKFRIQTVLYKHEVLYRLCLALLDRKTSLDLKR